MVIQTLICKICGNTSGNMPFVALEMMFGSKDAFEYFECGRCGCLQIKDIPENPQKYYPKTYYSLNESSCGILKYLFKRQLSKYCLHGKNIIGMLLSKKYGLPFNPDWFNRANVSFDSRILEVGCGTGSLLVNLHLAGFLHLTGIDPFIARNLLYLNCVEVLKKEVSEIDGQYDFIMLHHSFEHMSAPLTILKELHRLLKPNRYALIRIPIADSFAWKRYGINWVQLDAPRHLFLHTVSSMQILAEQTDFKVIDVVYDSTAFQFWASEQYIRGIPLTSNLSYGVNSKRSIFSKEQIRCFQRQSTWLNKNKEGDSACFYLYKS